MNHFWNHMRSKSGIWRDSRHMYWHTRIISARPYLFDGLRMQKKRLADGERMRRRLSQFELKMSLPRAFFLSSKAISHSLSYQKAFSVIHSVGTMSFRKIRRCDQAMRHIGTIIGSVCIHISLLLLSRRDNNNAVKWRVVSLLFLSE